MAIVCHSQGAIILQGDEDLYNPPTRIQKPKKDKDNTNVKSVKSGSPKILAGIPKKDGESKEEFDKRFIEKIAEM